jgi:hypothetical protein
MVLGPGLGGIWVVWLVASVIPIDPGRLPRSLRMIRFPVSRFDRPDTVHMAALRIESRASLRAYRVLAACLVVLSQTIQVRSATDSRLAATLEPAPLIEAFAEWSLMLAWCVFVVREFRRAGRG